MKTRLLFAVATTFAVISSTLAETAPKGDEAYDVVVVGGSAAGVAAAVAAREAGASVFLIAPRPYLGDDVAGRLAILKDPADDGSHPLMKELFTVRGKPRNRLGDVTPIQAKRVFDEALVRAGVRFLPWHSGCSVLRDADGRVAGVTYANRSGADHVVRAKAVVDATERATLARRAGARFRPFPAGTMRCSRHVISGDAPRADGLTVENVTPASIPLEQRIVRVVQNERWKQLRPGEGCPSVITASLWKCTFDCPMADGSGRSLAAAEQRARDLTWTPTTVDAADTLVFEAPDTLVSSVPGVFVAGPLAGKTKLGESMTAGADIGRLAAGYAALARPQAPVAGETEKDLFDCDVLVVGGGTGGAPAAIAAARSGAKTVLVEYGHRLGGVMTDGQIGLYTAGVRTGFTAELDRALRHVGSVYVVSKAEWFRAEARKAGCEILMGATACDVVKENGRIVGVRILLADHTSGIIRCKTAVDATGNAVLAAAAGEPTEFINGDELSVQGAGSTPRLLGLSYQNTDSTFIDDTDAEDLSFIWLRARSSFGNHTWDQAQTVNSRERRRMAGVYRITVQDIMCGRTFPDTVAYAKSNFDTHGQTVDPQFFIDAPHAKTALTVHVPYRAFLPRTTDGLLVIGLGMSAERDAMPVIRMQPDIQNHGYAAGLASALAVASGRTVRTLDVRALQRQLIEKGIVTDAVLTEKDNFPLPDSVLEAAVKTLPNGYEGLSPLLTDRTRALRLLGEAHARATGEARVVYAHVLGMLGDGRGADDLIAKIGSMYWDEGWNYRGMHQFGRSVSWVDSYMIALARSKATDGLPCVLEKAAQLNANTSYSHFRAVALACEAFGDKRAVPVLSRLLRNAGTGGHAMTRETALETPIEGYSSPNTHLGVADRERSDCLRELCLARALYRLGDAPDGLGRRTLEQYAADPRKAYANHARLVLGR